MKHITDVEIRLHTLTANNVIATSGSASINYAGSNVGGPTVAEVGGRGYYDEEEW